MHRLALSLCFGSALVASLDAPPELGLESEMRLEREFEYSSNMEAVSVEVMVNGEEQEVPDAEVTMEYMSRVAVVDVIDEAEDGRALSVSRTFDSLENTRQFSQPNGDEEEVGESELEGLTIVFTWSDDDEEYLPTYSDDTDAPDDELLDELLFDADLRELLPDDEVEVDDEWELDASSILHLFDPFGDVPFDTDDDDSIVDQIKESLDGTLTMTYVGRGDDDLEFVAEIVGDVEGSGSEDSEVEGDDTFSGEATRSMSLGYEFEGILVWEVDTGLLRSIEIEGMTNVVQSEVTSLEGPQGNVEIEQTLELEGEFEANYKTELESE